MSSSSGSLPRYIIQRLLLVIPMMWILMTLVFLLLRVAPGDPVSAALGGKISPQALENSKEQLGLNKPLIEQYWDYLSSVPHLDFGTSFTDNQPIIDVIKENETITYSDDERFDNDVMLMTGELAKMLADLVEALGGEAKA